MLLLAILGFGILAGAVAQLVLGTGLYRVDWGEALVAGLVGRLSAGRLPASSPAMACGCGRAA